MRFTSLRSTSIAGGATAKPSSAMYGILHQHDDDQRDQRQQIAPDRVDQQVENLGDRIGAGGQPRQKFRRMPLGEEGDAFAHQLGEQPALVVGEDGVADLRQDHGVAVGRRTLEDEDHDGDQRQHRDAAHVLVDIGLVDDLAEQIGGAGGGAAETPISANASR